MFKYLCLIILMFFRLMPCFGQYTNVKISTENSPEEPSICLHPYNQNIVIAGANINNYYYSEDAGHTWEIKQLSSSYGVWGDPCIISDKKGDFYFFHLSNPETPGTWIDRIVCQKTTDDGQTWNNGTFMGWDSPKAQDKEWATVDFTNNNIYCTWTQFDKYGSTNIEHKSNIMFSKSTDGSATWSEPIKINSISGNCIDDDNTAEGAVPAVGPNGEIYVAWALDEKLFFNKSTDEGQTWLNNELQIGSQPGGWAYSIPGIYRSNGLPVTCCDTSRLAHHGTIYVNWSDQRNGNNDTDIWLIKSSDAGKTWSNAIRINNDEAGKHQFFTWMTIDQSTGYLYFVFYDRRNHLNEATDVYLAVSKDGGETFTNEIISESPFMPNADVFFGDYTNISAVNGIIRPIWTRLVSTTLSVWTAIIDTKPVSLAKHNVFAENQTYPNPVDHMSYFSFKLKHKTNVTLSLKDIYGRDVKKIIDNRILNTGKYIEQVNMGNENMVSGIYFYSFICDNKQITKKVIFLNQ